MGLHEESDVTGTFLDAWCGAVRAFFGDGEEHLRDLLAFYDEGMTFQDPIRSLVGLPAFAEMNRTFRRRTREVGISFGDRVEGHGVAFAAWTMRVVPRFGPPLRVDGVSHLRVKRARIVAHRDSFDPTGSLADALPGAGRIYRAITGALA